MKQHLSEETIDQLEKNQLRGKAFADALLHLNSCSECQSRLIVPDKEEILKARFDDEDETLPSGGEKAEGQKDGGKTSLWRAYWEKIKDLLKLNYQLIYSWS